jgi:hypothetical protein
MPTGWVVVSINLKSNSVTHNFPSRMLPRINILKGSCKWLEFDFNLIHKHHRRMHRNTITGWGQLQRTPLEGQPVSRLRFKQGTSQKNVRRVAAWANLVSKCETEGSRMWNRFLEHTSNKSHSAGRRCQGSVRKMWPLPAKIWLYTPTTSGLWCTESSQ